ANAGWRIGSKLNRVALKLLRVFGATPGVVLAEDDFGGKVERIEPAELSQGHLMMADKSAEDIKTISGVNNAVMGIDSESQESGRLAAQRTRQGMVTLEPIFDNFDSALELFHTTSVELVFRGGLYTPDEVRQIVDDEDLLDPELVEQARAEIAELAPPPTAASPMDLAAPDLLPQQAQAVMAHDQQQLAEYEAMVEPLIRERALDLLFEQMGNVDAGRYSTTVLKSPSAPTERMANLAELEAIGERYPGAIPPAVYIRHSGLPQAMKDELIGALQTTNPAPTPTGAAA
ncbi:MAG: hypothetical protein PHU85_17065, partial [Phycisphaerae bacterium]|nr:hypothetical protein [Phycisphaerae bacterium]